MFSEWKNLERVYIAEFDFSNFFDNIKHDYLWKVIDRHGFLYTEEEKHIINSFLKSEKTENYSSPTSIKREKGIPQVSSISLFLANIACWELDKSLERLGVGFARYADDTIIWSDSYGKITKAYDLIKLYSQAMDVTINFLKSDGISILTNHKRSAEFKPKEYIEFVGYKISLSKISISEKAVKRIKSKVSYILYQNLLQPLNRGVYNSNRLSLIDVDYDVAISQIRRYLYGGLDDRKLRKYIAGVITDLNFRGLMSYYPLVSDEKLLAHLDGWLIYTIKQTLKLRDKLWYQHSGIHLPGPAQNGENWIDKVAFLKNVGNHDFRIPSFLLINKAMQVAIARKGIQHVTNPRFIYYE